MASRSGELATRPLPAVLLDLLEDRATGRLVLTRGRVSKTVDLVNGNPVSAASTPRDETLGHFLVGRGVITEDQHRLSIDRAAETGGKLGETLVELGVLTFDEMNDQLGKQARHKLVQSLRWPQGAWRFDATAEPADGVQLSMVEVVLGGLSETAVGDLGRLARLDGTRFELSARGQRLIDDLTRAFGKRALGLLATGAAIGEIERVFSDRAQARLAVDAMITCDAVTVMSTASRPAAAGPTGATAVAAARPRAASSDLFDMLFEDLGLSPDGSAPLDFPDPDPVDESGLVTMADVHVATVDKENVAATRAQLTAEHQRVRGADHYAVLMVGRRAPVSEVDTAFAIRISLLDRDASVMTDPRDRAKLQELRARYADARALLIDDRKRAAYDRELAGGELVQVPPRIDSELGFRVAEDLMARRQWPQAIAHLRTVISRSPGEADYHAALGWSEWMGGGESLAAADGARAHLAQALTINPDHSVAHEYKGRIDAALHGDDAEALFHLERALELDPSRIEAVAAIETLLVSRGELRRWERTLKRLLFRLRGNGTTAEAKAWARLARLYMDHLDDPQGGAAAAANARKIAPRDTDVASLIARTEKHRRNTLDPPRAGWREALGDPQSGAELVRNAVASGHRDAAFLAASTMVALGTADEHMAALYEQHRVHGVGLPDKPLDRDQWALLRHREDSDELGGLMGLIAPAVYALAPMSADDDVDVGQRLDEADLPGAFARVRTRCGGLLGVASTAVFARVELGTQIHVLASNPPVLVAGDEALLAPERPELVFRIVRAMTFLGPGRAIGASRPARVLRAVVMAIVREASGSSVGLDDPLAERAAAAVRALSEPTRAQARAAAMRLLSRGGGLNLSLWARSLSRTADRAGMLLCGDVPSAFAGAVEVSELDRDLQDFAYSAVHVNLRAQLGLSRG